MTAATAMLRERVLGGAELACAAWAVVGCDVLNIFPVQVPVLVVAGLVLTRLTRWWFD